MFYDLMTLFTCGRKDGLFCDSCFDPADVMYRATERDVLKNELKKRMLDILIFLKRQTVPKKGQSN